MKQTNTSPNTTPTSIRLDEYDKHKLELARRKIERELLPSMPVRVKLTPSNILRIVLAQYVKDEQT
ncbi:MAG: hypothetical protein HY869_21060 [Chloroflexi bacterium]|nr:hypothetical protein [Chloroflexota bacterium]